ncbi:universal stress protein [Allosalinactinospora lopnorensis]|uniref:universal stress protein n=1 Tax=Allosalinactinospora lopnorensis TaxID=1352348 RepID=UPI0009E48DEF|nr:universal stress protein [Allosalinactinospora lopnorensis]
MRRSDVDSGVAKAGETASTRIPGGRSQSTFGIAARARRGTQEANDASQTCGPRWPVVVGVEGSEADATTLAWAVGEAVRRGAPLHLVHAQEFPPWFARDRKLRESAKEEAGARAEELLERTRALVHAREAAVLTESHFGWGAAAAVLSNAAREASLVVVGASRREDEHHLTLRPVARQVAAHAPCSVIVAHDPGERTADGSVVVGVDGSRISEEAVGFAFEEAAYRGTGVVAVMAWEPEISAWPMLPDDVGSQRELAVAALAESVAGWRDRYPDVALEQRVVQGHPVRTLLEVAPEAALLVVGSRGHGWFPGTLLGSVSSALIRRSPVTLAIVRAPGA